MNDIIEAINTRVKSPYFGYSFLAFIGFNWKGIFLLATTVGAPQERLAEFDSATSGLTLFVCPLLVGLFVALIAPWIKYIFSFTSKKSYEFVNNLELDTEHQKIIKKINLEKTRSILFAAKENDLIDRAKRDEAVSEIEDGEIKEKLINDLYFLRQEKHRLSEEKNTQIERVVLCNEELAILKIISNNKNGFLEDDFLREIHYTISDLDQVSAMFYMGELESKKLIQTSLKAESIEGSFKYDKITHKGRELLVKKSYSLVNTTKKQSSAP